eukprot:4004644-Pleurochrysis_carterae.AAC.2
MWRKNRRCLARDAHSRSKYELPPSPNPAGRPSPISAAPARLRPACFTAGWPAMVPERGVNGGASSSAACMPKSTGATVSKSVRSRASAASHWRTCRRGQAAARGSSPARFRAVQDDVIHGLRSLGFAMVSAGRQAVSRELFAIPYTAPDAVLISGQ